MSAAELRQAAAAMRERAEADGSRGWYKVDFNEGDGYPCRPLWGVSNEAYFNPPADEDEPWLAVEVHTGTEATADHIASWHPAVALAVADLLERAADDHDETPCPAVDAALAVARAYLGTPADLPPTHAYDSVAEMRHVADTAARAIGGGGGE